MFAKTLAILLLLFLPSAAMAQKESREDLIRRLEKELEDLRSQNRNSDEMRVTNHPALMNLPNIEAWYLVQRDGSIKPLRGVENARHRKQWELLRLIVGGPVQDVYTTFVPFKSTNKTGLATFGAVAVTRTSPADRFGIALNQLWYDFDKVVPDAVVFSLMVPVLLHEHAGHTMINSIRVEKRSDGCLEDSHNVHPLLKRFSDKFWSQCAKGAPLRVKSDFTSDAAMRTVTEDFAETAASFTLCRQPPRNAKSAVAMKIRLFWEDQTYVSYRTKVRKALASAHSFGLLVTSHYIGPDRRCS